MHRYEVLINCLLMTLSLILSPVLSYHYLCPIILSLSLILTLSYYFFPSPGAPRRDSGAPRRDSNAPRREAAMSSRLSRNSLHALAEKDEVEDMADDEQGHGTNPPSRTPTHSESQHTKTSLGHKIDSMPDFQNLPLSTRIKPSNTGSINPY